MMRGNFKLKTLPKNGPDALETGCLYYPRKQTSISYAADCDVIVCYGGAKLLTSTSPPRCIALTTRLSETAPLGSKPFLTVDIACVTFALNGRLLPRQSKFV
jgi:hypothetical protein